jgi:toxin-antitoxin system PIN domain toxin
VIILDVNLLIYAIDRDSPNHKKARAWLEQTLSGTQEVGLPWVVMLAFLRVTTRHAIMRNPLSPEQALAYVDSWLQQPYVQPVRPGENHWSIFKNLVETTGTAGNLTADAHIAALALEQGFAICSTDNDFKRFPGIKHVNPLA